MPIPVRINPFLEEGCPPSIYAGLARFSPGCPPDRGRLHTCYSPVRRSPASESKLSDPLPLDLHVLSLPLAFILSQDQTLRCLYIFLKDLFSFYLPSPSLSGIPPQDPELPGKALCVCPAVVSLFPQESDWCAVYIYILYRQPLYLVSLLVLWHHFIVRFAKKPEPFYQFRALLAMQNYRKKSQNARVMAF